jgi:hypothetical protein
MRRRPIGRRMNPRRGRLAGNHALLAAVLLLPSLAWAQETPDAEPEPRLRFGPTEIRDEHLLAQPRLTLPATTPDTVAPGQTAFRASVLWSNSFGWTQNRPGEHPDDRRFLIDGEAATLDLTVTHGFRANLDAGLRLPLAWRGGGRLDGLIDAWHRLFKLPDGNRPDFLKDAFRVEGVSTLERPFSWNDEAGSGIGSVEAFARWRFSNGSHWTSALVARLAVPTATGPFSGNGPGLGLQWVAARRLGPAFDLFLGVGGTAQPAKPVRGVGYEPLRGHGFLALEWRPFRSLSLGAETDIASRLVSDIDRYPGTHWIINGELRVGLSRRAQVELGFTENFASQIATTDFAVQLGLRIRPASRRGSQPSGSASRR